MKPEYPVLYEKISIWIVTPLVYLWVIVYVQRAIMNASSDVFSAGMAAFGVTAGLSGVCFTMAATSSRSAAAGIYAGEKFLHSSILLIQTLLVVSVRDALIQVQFINERPTAVAQTKGIAAVLLSFVSVAAVWTWQHGFSEVNSALWKSWERRIRELNQQRMRIREPSAADSGTSAVDAEQAAPPDTPEKNGRAGER